MIQQTYRLLQTKESNPTTPFCRDSQIIFI